MDDIKDVQDVGQSTWSYIGKHDWWYILALFALAALLIYLAPPLVFHISFFALMALLIGYGIIRKRVQQEFIKEFGQSIGYSYAANGDRVSVRGEIFSIGHDQVISNLLSGTYQNIPTRIFNYTFIVGYGKDKQTYTYTIFEATFRNNMPDILLASDPQSLFWLNQSGNEHIKLEGDFNKYFTLRVPAGYELEAYEILTPDVMAKLIDKAQRLNFEFNGNKLYIYLPGIISTKEKMQTMFDLADYLIDLFNKSTAGVNLPT